MNYDLFNKMVKAMELKNEKELQYMIAQKEYEEALNAFLLSERLEK